MGRMKMLVLCNVHKRTQCTYLKEKGFAPPVFLVCLAACCASAPCKPLRALDTIGNCQRPVFSLGVSQVMHKITNLWKFELNRSSKLQENNGRKNILVAHLCVSRCLKKTSGPPEVFLILEWEINSSSTPTLLQREPFLTIKSSPLLVTK